MTQEFETQVLDVDVSGIVQKLRALGAKEVSPVLQKRYVFDILCLDSTNLGKGEWVRLRQTGGRTTLTYKNKRGSGISDTTEVEVGVDDFETASQILSALKCWTGVYYQENRRHKFTLGGVEFTFDTWPMIPTYLEVEGSSEQKVLEGLKMIGLEGKDSGHLGTLQIYKKYGIDLHTFPVLKF